MREFKHLERQFRGFIAGAVQDIELEFDGGDAVAELGRFGRECQFVDLVVEPQVEQAVLLGGQERVLPLELGALGDGVALGVRRLGHQHLMEPLANLIVLDADAGEEVEHLPIEFRLRDSVARMPRGCVAAAAVVDILARAAPGAFDLALTGDRMTAAAASDELTGEGHLVGVVDVPAQECLDPVPGRAVDQRVVLAGVPLAFVLDLAEIGAITQERVHLAAREPGC